MCCHSRNLESSDITGRLALPAVMFAGYRSLSGTSRAIALMNAAACIALADLAPCFQALWLPLGAPGLVPPCILHRRFPFTAGDWHSVPERVRAKQRGAFATRKASVASRSAFVRHFPDGQ